MFTVKTNFGQHRVVTTPNSKTYLHTQFPQDMRTVLTKLTSIETLLTQLVEITQAIEEQPLPAKRPRIDGSQSALGSMVQGTMDDIRIAMTSVSSGIWQNVILKDEVDIKEFLDFKLFLPEGSERPSHLLKSPLLIATSEELEAFDEYLGSNQDKLELFKIFLQNKFLKCNEMEKVIRDIIADELFLEYNYAGALGKKALQNMTLFDNLLYEICYNNQNHEEYVLEIKKVVHRAKNRIYKNRSISKAREALEAEIRESNPEDPMVENEAMALGSIFMTALNNDPSSSELFPITDPLKLEGLDRLLKSDQEKQNQFKQFLRLLMVKHEDPDKVILELTSAELYLKYNYSGTAGKKALKDMVLYDTLFYETCFKDTSYDEYTLELKRIILRNKNRAYKLTKQIENPKASNSTIIPEEDELIDNFEWLLETDLTQQDLANSKIFPLSTPGRLQALDDALKNSPLLQQLLASHILRFHERFHNLDKVIQRLVIDEVFMDYNYAGVWGKNTLKDMVLFEKLLYETCYKAQPFPIYLKDLIRTIQTAKNRIHRKNADRKRKGQAKQETEESHALLEEVLVEDALDEFTEELKQLEGRSDLNDSKLFPILTAANLKALDKCLQADPDRRASFTLFLRKLAPSIERTIDRMIKDEIFLEYNFQGIKGKKSLCDLILFDQVLYDAFGAPEGLSFQKYVKRIKKCCRRASNRVNKKRGMMRKMLGQSSEQMIQGTVNEHGDVIIEDIDIENEEVITDVDTDDSDDDNDMSS